MSDFVIDLYPGQERFGRIIEDGGIGGFVTAAWNTRRETRIRHSSVKQLANRRGGRRGYYRSPEAGKLAALLADVGRPDLAGEMLAKAAADAAFGDPQ